MRAKTGESEATRFGCKYADLYYAGEFSISEEEASEVYICAVDSKLKDIPECPFGALPDCLMDAHISDKWKLGIAALLSKVKTCELIPVELSPTKRGYECSDCGGIIRGDREFMNFCYHC